MFLLLGFDSVDEVFAYDLRPSSSDIGGSWGDGDDTNVRGSAWVSVLGEYNIP